MLWLFSEAFSRSFSLGVPKLVFEAGYALVITTQRAFSNSISGSFLFIPTLECKNVGSLSKSTLLFSGKWCGGTIYPWLTRLVT